MTTDIVLEDGVYGSFARIMVVKREIPKDVVVKRIVYRKCVGQKDIHKMLDHPNIIKFLESTEEMIDGKLRPVEILEYAANKDLHEYLVEYNNSMPHRVTMEVIKDVLRGLCYLHNECCLVHMDVKLENILLMDNLKAKVSDFDFTLLVGDVIKMPKIGMKFLRPPEIQDEKTTHEAACSMDMWSMGIVVFELFDSTHRIEKEDIQRIHEHVPNPLFPKKVNDMIHSLIVVDPTKRLTASDTLTSAILFQY